MIPLSYLLIAWLVLLVIFGIMLLLTLIQTLRHGLPTPTTYILTTLFLTVIALVLFGVSGHLLNVDWSQSVTLMPGGAERAANTYLLGL